MGAVRLGTFNETNAPRVWGQNARSRRPYVKDPFHRHVVDGERGAVNPEPAGTKACIHYAGPNVPAGGSVAVRLRLTDELLEEPLREVDEVIALRKLEADEFYGEPHPPRADEDERRVQRQALAGMLWTKQIYLFDVWDEQDKFFYDVLTRPDGTYQKFRVRSLVGLIPLYAVGRLEEDWIEPFREFRSNLHWFLENRQDVVQRRVTTIEHDGRPVHVLALVNPEQMRGLLERVWDPSEFRSDYGLRSLSNATSAAPSTSAGRGSPTSRPGRPGSSRAATPTGAGPSGSRLARPAALLRILPRRHGHGSRRLAPDRLDGLVASLIDEWRRWQ